MNTFVFEFREEAKLGPMDTQGLAGIISGDRDFTAITEIEI